jgi:hypothetical protein
MMEVELDEMGVMEVDDHGVDSHNIIIQNKIDDIVVEKEEEFVNGDNETVSNNNKQRKSVPDIKQLTTENANFEIHDPNLRKYHWMIVYAIIFILGISFLLPYNAFIVALDYYKVLYGDKIEYQITGIIILRLHPHF